MKKKLGIILIFFLLIGGIAFSAIPPVMPPGIIREVPEVPTVQESFPPAIQVQNIKQLLPQLEFKSPKEKEILKEKAKIKVEISDVSRVEFYLRQPQSLTEIYLGNAQKREDKEWELEIDTKGIPNGVYFLFAKISSLFGEYQSHEIQIEIKNEIERDVKKEEELKKEMEPKLELLFQKEKEMKEMVKENVEEMTQIIEEVVKEKLSKQEKDDLESIFVKYKEIVEKEVKIEKGFLPREEKERIKLEKENLKEKIFQKGEGLIEQKKEKLPLEELMFLKKESKENLKDLLEGTESILKEKIGEKIETLEVFFRDSDNDGLSDWDDLRIGTDPFNPDTDQDGYLDGIEFERGFDPKKPGPADKVVYQDPMKFGRVTEKIKVEKVEIIELLTGEKGLKISGIGIPNSFVTLYIFSRPFLVAVVKVNSEGYFEYTLDKPLVDGTHTVYVVLTNNKGEVEEKSVPYTFVKAGDKIMRIPELEIGVAARPLEIVGKHFLILTASIVLFSLSLAFFILGVLSQKIVKIK